MFYALIPFFAKIVKSQGIFFLADDIKKSFFKNHELRGVDLTLEDRVLNALSIVQTDFRNFTKPPLSFFRSCRDIVGDEKLHSFLSVDVGRVSV